MGNFWDDATVIVGTTRAGLLECGDLVDVSEMARKAGIKFPVAVSRSVWFDIEAVPTGSGQDVNGRLWDVLCMFRFAIPAAGDTDRVDFSLYLSLSSDPPLTEDAELNEATRPLYHLYALVHPGDHGEPVITIMEPGED